MGELHAKLAGMMTMMMKMMMRIMRRMRIVMITTMMKMDVWVCVCACVCAGGCVRVWVCVCGCGCVCSFWAGESVRYVCECRVCGACVWVCVRGSGSTWVCGCAKGGLFSLASSLGGVTQISWTKRYGLSEDRLLGLSDYDVNLVKYLSVRSKKRRRVVLIVELYSLTSPLGLVNCV